MVENRIMIFIDGSNFYYSTSKKGIRINFQKLVNELSKGGRLIEAFYYVAPLDIKSDEKKYWKHQRFIEILNNIPNFKVVLCTLKKIKAGNEFIYLVKGDDVKLSNNLIMGAVDNLYDTAIIVSGDEDFMDSINIVKTKYGKRVGNAYFSKTSSSNLRAACDFVINLDKILDKLKEEKNSSVLFENHTEH